MPDKLNGITVKDVNGNDQTFYIPFVTDGNEEEIAILSGDGNVLSSQVVGKDSLWAEWKKNTPLKIDGAYEDKGYIDATGNYVRGSNSWNSVVIPNNGTIKKIYGVLSCTNTQLNYYAIGFYRSDRTSTLTFSPYTSPEFISGLTFRDSLSTNGCNIDVPENANVIIICSRPENNQNYFARVCISNAIGGHNYTSFRNYELMKSGYNWFTMKKGYYNSQSNQIIVSNSGDGVKKCCTPKLYMYGAKSISVKIPSDEFYVNLFKFNGFYGAPSAKFATTHTTNMKWCYAELNGSDYVVVEVAKNSSGNLTDSDLTFIKNNLFITTDYNITNSISHDQTNIIIANADREQLLSNFLRIKNTNPGTSPNNQKTLSLLHFSDIHADSVNLKRIMEYYDTHSSVIDNILFTGDYVLDHYTSDGMAFWTEISGTQNILGVIGNHDATNSTSDYYATNVPQADLISKYFYNIANWGVTQDTGKTWWYKDYVTKNIRLIGLNTSLNSSDMAEQVTWLQNVLASSKIAGYSVIIAAHFPSGATKKNSLFTSLDDEINNEHIITPEIVSAVDYFINDGGEFICYLTGHTHSDFIISTSATNTQFCVAITTAKNDGGLYGDQARERNSRSNDAFNLVSIDTVGKTVKIIRVGANCDHYIRPRNTIAINYLTGNIVTEG